MTPRTRLALLAAASGVVLLAPATSSAAAPGLAITVPTSASFGARPLAGGSFSASLGTVKVTTTASPLSDASWVAKVTTTGFTTGSGGTGQVIAPGSVKYLSGGATAISGLGVGVCAPGQIAPVALSTQVTAFSCSGLALLTFSTQSLSWNPTITVEVGSGTVAGTYTGTITHSVA